MTKKYTKKKDETKKPNAVGPKYRTPSRFVGKSFSGRKFKQSPTGFNPARFKVQHKG